MSDQIRETSSAKSPWGVIGGTGLESLDGFEAAGKGVVQTPFGETSDPLFEAPWAMYDRVSVAPWR